MAAESKSGDMTAPVTGPLPPHVQIFDFLPESEHRRLLAWTLANQARFQPATVNSGRSSSKNEVDPTRRIALTTRKLDGIEDSLRKPLLDALEQIADATGYHGSPPTSLELEIAAHGEGAHFAPHIDIPVGPGRVPLSGERKNDRVVSAVYYFHMPPRGFSGGALRLYRFGVDPLGGGAEPNNHVDLEPVDNSLIAFPSWASHEVQRVSCPGGFPQYRFALNCWYCRPLGENVSGR